MERVSGFDGRQLAKLPIAKIQDVLVARLVAREEAARLGFPPAAITQIATAVSEITRNIVQHAGTVGSVSFYSSEEGARPALTIVVEDAGSGIPEPARVMQGSETAPGAGIPGARRLMDGFEIHSGPGRGTRVVMSKRIQ